VAVSLLQCSSLPCSTTQCSCSLLQRSVTLARAWRPCSRLAWSRGRRPCSRLGRGSEHLLTHICSHSLPTIRVKTVENSRENPLTIFARISFYSVACIFQDITRQGLLRTLTRHTAGGPLNADDTCGRQVTVARHNAEWFNNSRPQGVCNGTTPY
jgi:hypothetical protein